MDTSDDLGVSDQGPTGPCLLAQGNPSAFSQRDGIGASQYAGCQVKVRGSTSSGHRNSQPHLLDRWANPIRLGELFCGAGGMALGASLAKLGRLRFEHAWVTDVDEHSCRTIAQVIPPSRVIKADVRGLDFGNLGPIDGLVFGFPCNDFSVVGERRGISGEFGGLYKFGVKALEVLNPKFFVAENVSGLSSVNKKGDFKRIMTELAAAGSKYQVVEKLYQFEKYGIPQKRHRYILVGFRSDLQIDFLHPEPNGARRTAREALEGLPEDAFNNERTSQSQLVVDRLKCIRPGQNAFTATLPSRLKLRMKSRATFSQTYRRLMPDEPAYTVTGSGGGGTHMYHWNEPRALTNRERARLQTFPDDFLFQGGKESVRRQIGMAVPPDGARLVFQAVLESIAASLRDG